VPAVRSVLVIGAGASGLAAATFLAQGGIAVDLVETSPGSTALGSGITLQGNALRVLKDLGVWDRLLAEGYPFNTLGVRAPDPHGTLVAELDDVRMGGPELPASMGMYRPALARILGEQAAASGVKLRFATTADRLSQDAGGVEIGFTDGSTDRYDLVIGADGSKSWTRRALGIELETRRLGIEIWRAVIARPPEVRRAEHIFGAGPCLIAGYCPTGENSAYAYLVEPAKDRGELDPGRQLAVVRGLAGAYHGPWDVIQAGLDESTQINHTWFASHLLPAPWNRGRVVLIGDAVHVCPPTLAQGAALALEDAAVLTELLLSRTSLDDGLWAEFIRRRFERSQRVVTATLQMCRWLLDHDPAADIPALTASIAHLVAEPA
jgi:2-polyprenyl-6-methoxyphenol hydroxylase-like FAD-dependent oxidoreductase